MASNFGAIRINIQGGPNVGILYTVYQLLAHPVDYVHECYSREDKR